MTRFSQVSKNPKVPAKVKAALDVLFDDPQSDIVKAAAAVGMRPYKLREQLKKPHVRHYGIELRRARLDELCAGNIGALKKIRDEGENAMAAVAAVRTAENLRMDLENPARNHDLQRPAPGLVVVIETANGANVRTIGGSPQPALIEGEAERPPIEATYRSLQRD